MDPLAHHPLTADLLNSPPSLRWALWLACGKALGLPVGQLQQSIAIQMRAAQRAYRQHGGAWFTLHERLILARLAQRLGRTARGLMTWMVQPASLIRWLKRYQERQAQARGEAGEAGQAPCRPGRPRISPEIEHAIVTIARSGLTGLKRIQGELAKCGISAARSTIRQILDRHGLPPERPPNSTWTQFWRNHAPHTVGIDFVQVATGLWGKICYQFALIAIEHDTRRGHLLGVTDHPSDEWLTNVIRSATMDGESLAKRQYWIHDNDGKFQTLPHILQQAGLKSLPIAVGVPDMNAYAERFIGSLRRECLDHIVALNDSHLRHVMREYIQHYNTERPHQGIGNITIGPWQAKAEGEIVCDESLGGLLKSFRRAA
ncbi:MAG: hypothetical protein EA402_09800 [Planctomycetota bacterium]|nr:MAG: hypothetical protein EA402_09800 [Planctomycetota bacterium]